MKYLVAPVLIVLRILIAANFYGSLWNTRNVEVVENITSRYWPPMIYQEIQV